MTTIPNLPAATTINANDAFVISQGGVSKELPYSVLSAAQTQAMNAAVGSAQGVFRIAGTAAAGQTNLAFGFAAVSSAQVLAVVVNRQTLMQGHDWTLDPAMASVNLVSGLTLNDAWEIHLQAGVTANFAGIGTFATRALFVTWAATATPSVGAVFSAGGFDYRYLGTGTAISDLPGWVPNSNPYPEHWNATPNNSSDCSPAIQAGIDWLAGKSNGGTLYFTRNPDNANAIYAMATAVTLKAKVSLDATGARLRAKAAMAAMIDTDIAVSLVGISVTGGFWDGQLADRIFRFKNFQNLVIGGGNMELYGALRTSMTIGDSSITSGNYGFYLQDMRVSRPNTAYDVSAVGALESLGFSDSNFSRLLLMGYPKGFVGLAYISRFSMIHAWTYPLTQGQLLTGFDCSGGQNVYSQCQVDSPYTAAYWITGGDNYRFVGCTATLADTFGPTDATVPLFKVDLAANVQMTNCFGNDRAVRRFSDIATGTLTYVSWNTTSYLRYGTPAYVSHILGQQLADAGTEALPSWSFFAYPDTGFGMTGTALRLSLAGAEWMRWDRSNKTQLIGYTANLAGTSWGAIQISGTGAAGSSPNASLARASTDATGPRFYFAKYRGALGSYGLVSAADTLGEIVFHGGDGATTQRAASISAIVEGTPALGDVRAGIRFSTGTGAGGAITEQMRMTSGGQLAINTATPDASAKVQIDSTTRGFLPPRMTTAQRDAIASPLDGLQLYNSDTAQMQIRQNGEWASVQDALSVGMLSADYTLTSVTTAQKLFNWSTNGALTLKSGVYRFEALLQVQSMSATSGNAGFDILGAGTAILNRVFYNAVGVDSATPNTASTQYGSFAFASASPNPIVVGAVGTGMGVRIAGLFEVTTGGTVIPSILLGTAAAAIVKAGSAFTCQRIGPTGATAIGAWS